MMNHHQGQVPETYVSNSNNMDFPSDQANHADRRGTMSSNGGDSMTDSDDGVSSGIKFEDWGFQVDRLFEVAYRFYKRNENKIFHPSYDERNQLIALILQARYGNFDGGRAPDVGALDLVGKSRQRYWATLKGMSKTEAMSKFILTLNELCPLFKVHAEAVKISCDSQMPPIVGGSKATNSSDTKQTNSVAAVATNAHTSIKKDEKLQAIYTSLCRQTYQQFKGYAMKQYPNDVQQQKYLISSLQEQYYQQYISQMHPELKLNPLPDHQLKSSLSPAASETSSSMMHENGDDMSIASTKTDQERAPIDANPSDQYLYIDQVDSTKPNEEQPQSSTAISLITIVDEKACAPGYDSKLEVEPQPKITNGDGELPAAAAADQSSEHNYGQASRQPPLLAAKFEAPLPKPNPYQPVDLQSIGKFESFPRPKPIPSNVRQAKTTTDVPPTPPKPVADPPKPQPQPEYTAIDFGDEELPSSKEEISRPANNQILAPSPSAALPSEQLPPPPPQELPLPPPIAGYHPESPIQISPSTQHHHQQQTKSQSPPLLDNINNQPVVEQQQSSFTSEISPEKKAPLELWGCDSSNSSGDDEVGDRSPVEQHNPIVYDSIEPATIWTKRGCTEFKESLVDDKQAGMYVVKQGTLVTIQMPTYPDGRYIYWEFATEDYDIGFGLDFVYESNLGEPLAIKIFEETDEDDDEDCDDILGQAPDDDAEAGVASASDEQAISSIKQRREEKLARISNTVSIIPTYRRDSHEEIFVGRHKYPGRGYYLLKFDNTYSVLRSKTIFFRICYFI